jgi:hypothetical protein
VAEKKKTKPAQKVAAKAAKKAVKKPVKAPKKPKKPKKPVKAVKKVELKKLREQFAGVLAVLTAKSSASPEVSARLDDSRRRISQWMTDVDDICSPELQEICGPDMVFPVP